ncbi:hypothetical protein IJJ12_02730 [bacterium]|nr:hypothetical protein [bacterium]
MTNMSHRTGARTPALRQDQTCQPDSLSNDMLIRALGRWNEQGNNCAITRRNGFASYSLLRTLMMQRIAC